MEYKYVVVSFVPPDLDNAEFEEVVGVYDDKAIADEAAKNHAMAFVYSAPYHKA